MALHFPILVNGNPIGYVSIRRLNERVLPERPSEYEFAVEYPEHDKVVGKIWHYYNEGALVLIQKVMAAVIERKRDALSDLR